MAAKVAAIQAKQEFQSHTRQRVMGIIFLGLAAVIWFYFGTDIEPGALTKFRLKPGRTEKVIEDWIFQTSTSLNVLATLSAALGAYQLARGFGRRTNLILGVVSGLFIFGFLSWAASGGSINIAGLFRTTLVKAVPITLGALSGILCERSGVVNIAIEGMMLAAAMVGSIVSSATENIWLGLLGAIVAGAFLGLIHGILSIKYKTDQIISGTVINIFATGITSFVSAKFLQKYPELNSSDIFPLIKIPVLSELPFIGPILFNHNFFVYATIFFLIVLHFAFFHTRWGLRVRSVGEHPKAADTLGINVFKTRYMSVILGGMMAGVGGAYFTIGSVGRFDEVMTAGRGFIGLAAMIFGNWKPFGSFGAGLLFGFADMLASKLAILGVLIPSEFLLMAPYIATMVVLAGVVGRGQMPAADGTPYEKE